MRAEVKTRSADWPTRDEPVVGEAHDLGRGGAQHAHPRPLRMVEVENAGRLAKHFQHVEIAIGVERIAGIVAGDHHRDAGGVELVQRGDPAQPRGSSGGAILQVHVAHRQRHDGDAGLPHSIDDARAIRLRHDRQRAAMSGDDRGP